MNNYNKTTYELHANIVPNDVIQNIKKIEKN